MNKFDSAVETFIAAVMDTEEYREYDAVRNKLKQYPELKAQVDEYRKRNFMLQTDEDTAFEKIDQFEREYEDFRENPLVEEFLAGELAFCRMLQTVNLRITEAIHFE